MLRIIGDTHVRTFTKVPSVVTYDLGNISALNISKYSYDILSLMKEHSHDPWAFCVGELDCRLHIFDKSVKLDSQLQDVIEYVADKYLSFVDTLNNTFDAWIIATPPQGPCVDPIGRAFYAQREHRQGITHRFNAYVKRECILRDIRFLDLWSFLGCTQKDLLNEEYYCDDLVHLKTEYASKTLRAYLKTLD
jgi:hypothetical protein